MVNLLVGRILYIIPLMFIIGLVMGLILGLTLALSMFALFLLQLTKQGEIRRKTSSVDRYA